MASSFKAQIFFKTKVINVKNYKPKEGYLMEMLLNIFAKAQGKLASLYKCDSMTADYSQVWNWQSIDFDSLSYTVDGDKVTLFDSETYCAEECELDTGCFMWVNTMPGEGNSAMFAIGANEYVLT